jgi:hypothetical protein
MNMNQSVVSTPSDGPPFPKEEEGMGRGAFRERFVRGLKKSNDEGKLTYLAWLLVIGISSMKLSVTIVHGTALELVLLFLYAMLVVMLLKGMVEIKPLSFITMLVFLSLMTVAAVATDSKFTSAFYVYLNYIPFIFCVRLTPGSYIRFINIHQMFMLAAAILAFVDWIFQVFNKPIPNMEHYIPAGLRFFNFNYIQPLEWGSKFVKPNAFIFLETSYLAQAMAAAFIIEFCLFRRTLWMGIYISALTITFGGTGYGLLLLSIPVLIYHARGKTMALSLALAPLALFLAASFGVMDNIQLRMSEFSQQNTSGDQRFGAQLREVKKHVSDPLVLLRGIGAGNTLQDTSIMWIPPVKVSVEYGFLVGAVFIILIVYSATSGGTPFAISLPLLLQYMIFNGGFLVPISVFYLLVMTCLVKPTKDIKPMLRDSRRVKMLLKNPEMLRERGVI